MIIPTLRIRCQKAATADVYGQPVLGAVSYEMVSPVKLEFTSQHTTVRTDSAASHGHGYETTSDVLILAKPASKIGMGDILTIIDTKVSVVKLHPRYRLNGRVDHIEIHCTTWK